MLKSTNLSNGIDKTDIQILELMTKNHSNKDMSSALMIPLSTVQRRARNLIDKGFIVSKNYIDYTKFGFMSGTIHIYLSDGNMDVLLDKVSKLKGVNSLEVHIGNSDIVAGVVYKEGKDLLNVIAPIKRMAGVERIVWSERIFEHPIPSNTVSLYQISEN